MALPKFMIADDPVTDPDNEYIIHTQSPRFVAQRIDGDDDDDDDENSHIDIVEEIDDVDAFFADDPDKKEALLEELKEWYYEYMDWLDEDDE